MIERGMGGRLIPLVSGSFLVPNENVSFYPASVPVRTNMLLYTLTSTH